MKLLCLGRYNPAEQRSGPEKVAARLFGEFARDEAIDALFVEYFFDGGAHSLREKLFGRIHPVSGERRVLRLGIARALATLLRWKPDVIAVLTYERFVVAPVWLATMLRIPVLMVVHGVVRHENAAFRPGIPPALARRDRICERFLFRHAQALVFLSAQEVEIARQFEVLSDDRITLLPNAADDCFFGIERPVGTETPGPLRLLFASDPARPEKGWSTLASALEGVDAEVEVTVVTRGGLPRVENTRVRMRSAPPRPAAAFAEAMGAQDCIVVASFYEPFSLVAVEAMAAGLAAIVTRETGMTRYVRHGEHALLFDAGDAPTLRAHIELLARDPALRNGLSARGRDAVRDLTWPRVAATYRDLIGRLAARGRGVAR